MFYQENQERQLQNDTLRIYQTPEKVCEYQQYEVMLTNIESNFDGQHIVNYTQSRLQAQQLMHAIQQIKIKIKQAERNAEKMKYQCGNYEQQIYQLNIQISQLKQQKIGLRHSQIAQIKKIAQANCFEKVVAQYETQLMQNQKTANINLLNFVRNFKSIGIVKKIEQLIDQQQIKNKQFQVPLQNRITSLQKKISQSRKSLKIFQQKLQNQQIVLNGYRKMQESLFKKYNQILNKKQQILGEAYRFVKNKAVEAYKQYLECSQQLSDQCFQEQFIESMVLNFEENLEVYFRTYVKMRKITQQISSIKKYRSYKKTQNFLQENQTNLFNITASMPKQQIEDK